VVGVHEVEVHGVGVHGVEEAAGPVVLAAGRVRYSLARLQSFRVLLIRRVRGNIL